MTKKKKVPMFEEVKKKNIILDHKNFLESNSMD